MKPNKELVEQELRSAVQDVTHALTKLRETANAKFIEEFKIKHILACIKNDKEELFNKLIPACNKPTLEAIHDRLQDNSEKYKVKIAKCIKEYKALSLEDLLFHHQKKHVHEGVSTQPTFKKFGKF